MSLIFVISMVAFSIFVVAVVSLTASKSDMLDNVLYFVIYSSAVASMTSLVVGLLSELL